MAGLFPGRGGGKGGDFLGQTNPGPVPDPGVVAPVSRLPPEGISPVGDVASIVQGFVDQGVDGSVCQLPAGILFE